jgi:hypothetical protein
MDKLLIVLGALVLVIIGPLLTIWALDTLFPVLNIPYSLETWFAAAILTAGFAVRSNKKG